MSQYTLPPACGRRKIEDQGHEVSNWHPRMSYVWTKKQCQLWLDTQFGMYDGTRWKPVIKSLGVGRFNVTFTQYDGK